MTNTTFQMRSNFNQRDPVETVGLPDQFADDAYRIGLAD